MTCPYMHCIRDSYFIVKKMNFSLDRKERDGTHKRKKIFKFHAFKNKLQVYKDVRK